MNLNFQFPNITKSNIKASEPLSPPLADEQRSARVFYFCEGLAPRSTKDNPGASSAVIASEDTTLWMNGETIAYGFCEDDNTIQRNKVHKTLQQWAPWVNLTFQYQPDIDQKTHIRISFKEPRNFSELGKQPKIVSRKETMMLGSVTSATVEATALEESMILHEWGHVLGLYHEHQSRGLHIAGFKWKKEATRKYFQDYFKTNDLKALDEWLQINVYSTYDRTNYGAFDPWSIMTYSIPSDCYEFDGVENVYMKLNYTLSARDIAYMVVHYPKPGDVLALAVALEDLRVPPRVSRGWDHTNTRQKFWDYQRQLRYPSLYVTVERPLVQALEPGQVEVYNIVTRTNLWEFQATSRVVRQVAEIQRLFEVLSPLIQDWVSPGVPQLQAGMSEIVSRWHRVMLFMKEISLNIGNQNEEFREELRKFLQGD